MARLRYKATFIILIAVGLLALEPAIWNSRQLKPNSPRAAVDDVAYFEQLLDQLKTTVTDDDKQVFVVGHSNGGMMAFRLASELSERFTAVVAVAGLLTLENPQPRKPLPTLCILGSKDPLMPIAGGEVKLPWGTRQYKPVTESLSRWAKAIDCEGEPKSDNGDRPNLNWTTPAIKAERVQYQTFDSAAVKSRVSYHVYAPEAYEKEKDRRFPVLYWLHGTGGGLAGNKPLSEFFNDAIRNEKIPPMLVVFPNGLASSMWCDSKDGRVPMETVLIKELIPHIDKTFRTVANRDGRLLEGFSMGGYGAGRLGFIYSEIFGTVSILAGGPMDLNFQGPRAKGNPAERERILKDTFGNDLDEFKAQSPLTVAEKNASAVNGKSLVRVAVGERDFTADLNRDYSEHLNKLKVDHELTVVPGVAHETMPLLKGLGEANWKFYRTAFGKK